MKTLFHDSNQYVHGYGYPDLGFHRILRSAIERLDSEMLLDPLEEQLDLPATLVQMSDGRCWQHEVVGQEDQVFSGFGVVELDSPDLVRVFLCGIEAGEETGLIADQTTGTIDLIGIHPSESSVALCPGDEESLRAVDVVEPCVIEITSVHDIEGSGLRNEVVEDIDIVDFTIGNESPGRDASSQIEQGMQFDCGLCLSERCPWEQFETQIDSGRIKRVDRFIEFHTEAILSIKTPCLRDHDLSEIGKDAPVPSFVCFGNGTSGNRTLDTHVVTFFGNSAQTGFNISQTFPVSQLSKGHAEKLVPAGERSHSFIAFISLSAPAEFMHGEEVHKLRENQPAGIHMHPPRSLSGE